MARLVRASLLICCLLLAACAQQPRYNSLDLALLPCEDDGGRRRLFFPVEFDAQGDAIFQQQISELERTLHTRNVSDLIIFAHGWNKNPSSAELDYQNFLCRLHAKLRSTPELGRRDELVIVGIFWPSTISNREKEPTLLMPISYYRIRDRADKLAELGLAPLLTRVSKASTRQRIMRLNLIGHSFGARMLVRSLETLQARQELVPFLLAPESVSVALLNAAIPASRFNWIAEAISNARSQRAPARFTSDTSSYLFNIHSFNDSANRVLFPMASIFNDDDASCAVGACGVAAYATLCVDASGKLEPRRSPSNDRHMSSSINAWNVDATKIIFAHSDIYKGRVASLVADLLYEPRRGERFRSAHRPVAKSSRCTE